MRNVLWILLFSFPGLFAANAGEAYYPIITDHKGWNPADTQSFTGIYAVSRE
jgi:hypothetical protein